MEISTAHCQSLRRFSLTYFQRNSILVLFKLILVIGGQKKFRNKAKERKRRKERKNDGEKTSLL